MGHTVSPYRQNKMAKRARRFGLSVVLHWVTGISILGVVIASYSLLATQVLILLLPLVTGVIGCAIMCGLLIQSRPAFKESVRPSPMPEIQVPWQKVIDQYLAGEIDTGEFKLLIHIWPDILCDRCGLPCDYQKSLRPGPIHVCDKCWVFEDQMVAALSRTFNVPPIITSTFRIPSPMQRPDPDPLVKVVGP